jgi:hypothetical protein
MKIIQLRIVQGQVPMGEFKFGVSVLAESLLYQLDWQELLPVDPTTGQVIDEEVRKQIKEHIGEPPSAVTIPVDTAIQLVQCMMPASEEVCDEKHHGSQFMPLREIMLASLTKAVSFDGMAVHMVVFPQ